MLQLYLQLLNTCSEQEKFKQLYETYHRLMHWEALRVLQDRQLAEDAVQEALRKCWQKRGQLRDARYLQTWVIRVLLNECHNIQRRAARLQPCATLPERAAAPQPMGTTRVGEALLELEEKLRMPLVLHYMEGYSVADVAAVLRIPQGTVKTRLRRGREALKALLTPPIGGVSRDPG